jgi:hypothetical protein
MTKPLGESYRPLDRKRPAFDERGEGAAIAQLSTGNGRKRQDDRSDHDRVGLEERPRPVGSYAIADDGTRIYFEVFSPAEPGQGCAARAAGDGPRDERSPLGACREAPSCRRL